MAQKLFFPDEFLWGAATAAHQVEGLQKNDWVEWEKDHAKKLARTAPKRLRKRVANWPTIRDQAKDPKNYVSSTAARHYQKYEEDIELLAELGLNSYRFSIEWSRIEPEPGIFDEEAIAHYRDVIATCRKHNIEPILTMHHFTNPTWFLGWHEKHATVAFEKYVSKLVESFGSKVTYWLTFNEPTTYILMRYLRGSIWPGWPEAEYNWLRAYQAFKNIATAHQKAYELVKTTYPQAQISFPHGCVAVEPKGNNPLNAFIARAFKYLANESVRKKFGLEDFIALHYYTKVDVAIGLRRPSHWITQYGRDQVNDMGWNIYPQGFYNVLMDLKKYNKPVLITENGIPDALDEQRESFIQEHLHWMHKAMEDGVEVIGYLHWSLLDNFEWAEGFWPKFGLIEVDRKTQARKVKDSARAYGQIAQNNQLIVEDEQPVLT